MRRIRESISRGIDWFEPKLSLVIHGAALVASFTIPAWAVRSAHILSAYAPFSWVVAGFAGVGCVVLFYFLWQAARRMRVTTKYDLALLDTGANFNPLDNTFERKRVFIDKFVLPSSPFIDGKTFIDCDIIGPANLYFHFGNQAWPLRGPTIDAVCLDPQKSFNNGFVVTNCIFRNCSFQRITVFVSQPVYEDWKTKQVQVNWISPAPPPMLNLPTPESQPTLPPPETSDSKPEPH